VSGYVFISYAREDRRYVEQLALLLEREKIDAWYDAHLVHGQRFDDSLQARIAQCSAFIIVMTPAANASDWVLEELDYAKANDRDVMPISIDGGKVWGTGRRQAERVQGHELPSAQFIDDVRALIGEGELRFELKVHDGQVRSVAYPAGNPSMVASAGPEMCVRIWNPNTGELLRELRDATWPVSFTKAGDKLATGGPGHTVHLWDTATGELVKTIGQHKKPLTSVAVSPDEKLLVTGSSDTLEHIWDLQSGQLLRTLGGRVKPASPLVISPDGTWLVAPTESGSRLGACLWDVQTGRRIGSLSGHRGPVHDVTASWDGRFVATAGEDHTARIWDVQTGDEVRLIAAHTRAVRAVAFSPNGYRLATGSLDRTIRLWDATNGAHIRSITNRAGGIYDLAYSPDGRTLASGHGDGAIRIWKV
jgi:WD40 repeat protein